MLNGRTKTKKGTSEYEQHRRFTFTGKERDPETGYSYFGARYYDCDLSGLFFSVDPMSDKYPSLSPYAYCAWNPLKLVNPDGRTIWLVDEDGTNIQYNPNMELQGGDAVRQQIKSLNGMYSTDLGMELIDVPVGSDGNYFISNESPSRSDAAATIGIENVSVSKKGGNNDIFNLSHELFLAFQFGNGQGVPQYITRLKLIF